MPIFKYAKVLLQTLGIGSVLICFAGLSLGIVLIFEWGTSAKRVPIQPGQHVARPASQPIAASAFAPGNFNVAYARRSIGIHLRPSVSPAPSRGVPVRQQIGNAQKKRSRSRLIFEERVASDQLGFLTDYAGRPANEVIRERRVLQLMNMVIPYAPFHFGLDIPLPSVLEAILRSSPLPVEIREARYLMVSTPGERGRLHGRRQGFIWIDLQRGIVLGGIFFYPSNGEPTPTLTLFSKQVKDDSLRMNQLPLAFTRDLSQWTAMTGIPPITTRYFINASSKKTVLAHEEDFCKRTEGISAPPKDVCRQMNANAADIDRKAVSFLDKTHYAPNATMHMIADTSHF